jgi:hypothetical protein
VWWVQDAADRRFRRDLIGDIAGKRQSPIYCAAPGGKTATAGTGLGHG